MSARARAWLVSVALALAWSAAWSQSGGLRVIVVDATDNSPLPGATVTLTSDVQLVPETSVLTESEGRAVFRETGTGPVSRKRGQALLSGCGVCGREVSGGERFADESYEGRGTRLES